MGVILAPRSADEWPLDNSVAEPPFSSKLGRLCCPPTKARLAGSAACGGRVGGATAGTQGGDPGFTCCSTSVQMFLLKRRYAAISAAGLTSAAFKRGHDHLNHTERTREGLSVGLVQGSGSDSVETSLYNEHPTLMVKTDVANLIVMYSLR